MTLGKSHSQCPRSLFREMGKTTECVFKCAVRGQRGDVMTCVGQEHSGGGSVSPQPGLAVFPSSELVFILAALLAEATFFPQL